MRAYQIASDQLQTGYQTVCSSPNALGNMKTRFVLLALILPYQIGYPHTHGRLIFNLQFLRFLGSFILTNKNSALTIYFKIQENWISRSSIRLQWKLKC